MTKKLLFSIALLLFFKLSIFAQWQAVGPYGGIVRCFDTVGTTVFIGTDGAGVLKSTNGGSSWTGSSTGIANLQIYGLAHSGATMVAGTYGGGVFKSTDGGANWTAINSGLTNLAINAVAISGSTIYAGTPALNGGMFVSTNGGSSWTLANTGMPANVYILAIAVSGSTVYAGTGTGVFMSTNSGSSWTAISNGLPDQYVNSIAVNGSTLYAGTNSGVSKSVNNGGLWSLIHSSSLVTSIFLSGSSIYSSFGTQTAGGIDISTNNGVNWNTAYSGLACWAVTASNSIIYAGTNGDGVFSSTNGGTNWAQTSVGINNINTPAVLLASGTNIFAGAFLGGIFRTTNNGGVWNQMNTGLTNIAVQALGKNSTNIFASASGSGGGVFTTTNNGSNWTAVNSGLTSTNITAFATNNTQIFAGSFDSGVFLSNNNGGSWSAINTGLTNTTVQALALNGSNLFAGTFYGGVFFSSNSGGNWSAVNNGLGNLNVNALSSDSNKVFAGTNGGVFVTKDNGANWVAKNNGLSNTSVLSLATSGAYIFAGTSAGGVYFSCDTGNTWNAINDGMFDFSVQSIAIADSFVFAAAHGGAVFKRPLSEVYRAGVTIALTAGTNPTCQNSALTFTATPACGGCPASYQWKVNGNNVGGDSATFISSSLSNGQTVTCVLTSNLPGIYNNPATSNGITVTVNPAPPTPTISQNGTTLTSSASSGNQWYLDGTLITGATSQNYTINQNGSYTVIVTSGSCVSDTSTVLVVNASFTAGVSIAQTGGTNPSCAGSSITFTATAVNGGSTPSYLWMINGSPVGTDSPTYTTTTLTSGQIVSCLMTSSMNGVNGNPASSNSLFVTVNTPPSAPTITQSGYVLTSSALTGNQWFLNGSAITGATGHTLTVTQNGSYTVHDTVGACVSPLSTAFTVSNLINVSAIISVTSGSNPSCVGNSVTFTANVTNGGTGPAFQWKVDGVNVSGANSITFTTSTLTNGQIVTCLVGSNMPGVTNSPTTSNAITMTINSTPAPTITQSGMVLTSSASSGNQWYLNGSIISGATSQNYTITQNGSYTVKATVNGCISPASTPIVISNAFTASVVIAITSGANPTCESSSVTFTATPTNGGSTPTYQWKINGNTINGATNATYTSTTLSNGQIVTSQMTSNMPGITGSPATSNAITMVVNSLPAVPTITQSGSLLTSSATSGNAWIFNGTQINDAFGQSYTAPQNGTYTVSVTVNGCTSTSAPFNVVNIGFAELSNETFVKVYPNPNDGNFTIAFNIDIKTNYVLEIRNTIGQLVYTETLTNFSGIYSKPLTISEFGKGIYSLSLISKDRKITKRLIIQ